MLPKKYRAEFFQPITLEDDITLFKMVNLPEEIKNNFSEIYINHKLDGDDYNDIVDILRDSVVEGGQQYLLCIVNLEDKTMDLISFCSICVYRQLFDTGIHPENADDAQLLEAVVCKYEKFVDNGHRHDH